MEGLAGNEVNQDCFIHALTLFLPFKVLKQHLNLCCYAFCKPGESLHHCLRQPGRALKKPDENSSGIDSL
jgi:hypothetical protein